MRRIWTRAIWGLILLLAATGAAWLAWPRPVGADLATANRAPMEVVVEDEGKTEVRHVYTLSAPIAGRVLRISPPLHVGDTVTADETVVAQMQPVTPSFLDVRSREELQAAVGAADAAVQLAGAEVRRIEAALNFAQSELRRAETLSRTDAISARALDQAKLNVQSNEAALASAKAQLEVRRSERASAAARLIDPSSAATPENPSCCIQLRAPVTGRVLKIIQESEGVIAAGAPLINFGDPRDLEVVADFLSSDAVQIRPGASVRIDGWGGAPIQGRVQRVDPAGFLKVSALGIEEQRVRTTIQFVDPPESWSRLGHDYRVIVHVAVWNADDVLTVPLGALFREGDDWAVYSVSNGRVHATVVQIGHRNNRMAEVLSGLSEGDQVVLHPSDRIKEGTAVAERPTR